MKSRLLMKLMVEVVEIAKNSVDLVRQANTPIDLVNERLEEGEEAFNSFKIIVTPLEKIPKIGSLFKTFNVPIKGVGKAMKVRVVCRFFEIMANVLR